MDSPKEESRQARGTAFLILLTIGGGIWVHNAVWGEREGSIRTDDRRIRITLEDGSKETWFKNFTCSYRRTNKGTILAGQCEAVETNSGACETVYSYSKKAPKVCTDPKVPYLGYDDLCHDTVQAF